jgi:Tol biopolymer transport system component
VKRIRGYASIIVTICFYFVFSSSCTPGQIFGPTVTPSFTVTPTFTNTPTPTITPTFTPTLTPTITGGFAGEYVLLKKNDAGIVTMDLYDRNFNAIRNIWTAPGELTAPYVETKWSPSGDVIAFEYLFDGSYLSLYTKEGSEIITLYTKKHTYGGVCDSIYWSPDGKYLIFISSADKGYFDIYRISKDGKEIVQLTNTYTEESCLRYLPDGEHIFFSIGNSNVIMNIEDKSIKYLTNLDSGILMDWSPDGKLATYRRKSELYIYNFDSGELSQITHDGMDGQEGRAEFSKDGRWILYRSYLDYSHYGFFVVPSDLSTKPVQLNESTWDAHFLPDGSGLIYSIPGETKQTGPYQLEIVSYRYFIEIPIGGKDKEITVGGQALMSGIWSMQP